MANVKGVIIQDAPPKGGANTPDDSISGMVLNGVASGSVVLGQTEKLTSIRDAETLGITPEYDATNSVLVWYHINEFYQLTKELPGTVLYIMVIPQTIGLVEMIQDATEIYSKKLLSDANSEISSITFAYNPTVYAPLFTNGIDSNVLLAIPQAQALADFARDRAMPIVVGLEGKGFEGDETTLEDLTNLLAAAPDVYVPIFQDWEKAESLALYNLHAAVGTMLGAIAAKAIHVNVGFVKFGNLTDLVNNRWRIGGLSDHSKVVKNDNRLQQLEDKHWIFVQTYNNIDGLYISNDHTAIAEVVVDNVINRNNIRYVRTHNKAHRVLYAILIPEVKGPQSVDPATGKLLISTVVYFKGLGEAAIDAEMRDSISGRKVIIDKNSDLLTGSKALLGEALVVPEGSVNEILINLSLNNAI